MFWCLFAEFDAIVVVREDQVIVSQGHLANSFSTRLKGLMFDTALADNEGLWLSSCNSVHTLGMRFVIDVVFLDDCGVIVRLAPGVRPNRFARSARASNTLELAAGSIERLGFQIGQTLAWRDQTAVQY